jgi:hypothetical protein
VTPRQLRKNRRYAIVACAGVAAFLPGDAITLALETIPLYVLYEVSILLAVLVVRAEARRQEPATDHPGDTGSPSAGPGPSAPGPPEAQTRERDVQEIIDHVDRELSD